MLLGCACLGFILFVLVVIGLIRSAGADSRAEEADEARRRQESRDRIKRNDQHDEWR